jgi:hypothetical protein
MMRSDSCSFPEVAVDGKVELIWAFEEEECPELEEEDSVEVNSDICPGEEST